MLCDVVLENQGVMWHDVAWQGIGCGMTWRLNVICMQCGER